jgi:hypothetical protein
MRLIFQSTISFVMANVPYGLTTIEMTVRHGRLFPGFAQKREQPRAFGSRRTFVAECGTAWLHGAKWTKRTTMVTKSTAATARPESKKLSLRVGLERGPTSAASHIPANLAAGFRRACAGHAVEAGSVAPVPSPGGCHQMTNHDPSEMAKACS